MKMLTIFKNFATKEIGAVTIEWVVVGAFIVGGGFFALTAIQNGANTGMTNAHGELASGISTGF